MPLVNRSSHELDPGDGAASGPFRTNRVGDPSGAGGDRARILDRYRVHG
jgi:hypothetical protein